MRCCVETSSAWITKNIVAFISLRNWNNFQYFCGDRRKLAVFSEVFSQLGVQVSQLESVNWRMSIN
jgi:hypothetical protein